MKNPIKNHLTVFVCAVAILALAACGTAATGDAAPSPEPSDAASPSVKPDKPGNEPSPSPELPDTGEYMRLASYSASLPTEKVTANAEYIQTVLDCIQNIRDNAEQAVIADFLAPPGTIAFAGTIVRDGAELNFSVEGGYFNSPEWGADVYYDITADEMVQIVRGTIQDVWDAM